MPIYMDRHYVEGASIHEVNNAHEKDLATELKFGVKFLTYWFDQERSTAFCLVDSPNKQAIIDAHDAAHGMIPHEILEVDPSMVQAFLGRIADPEQMPSDTHPQIDSAFRVIMFTDLMDSTLMTTLYGDKKALHLLHIHNTIVRNALREFSGSEIKHTGDGIMASFNSIDNAVDSAIQIQKGFTAHNEENAKDELFLRIGLSAGEPIEEQGDLFGNTVQLSARLCAKAKPEQILAEKLIMDLYEGRSAHFINKVEFTPKGFKTAVSMYEVVPQGE